MAHPSFTLQFYCQPVNHPSNRYYIPTHLVFFHIMKFLASIVKQHPSIAMKCCTLTTPGASVWAAVFSWQGGRVQGPHTEMCRSSGCLHHRGRYPSLYLNTVFPPVTSTPQYSTLPQMSTSLPVTQLLGRHLGSLLLIMHGRTSILTW